MNLVTFLSFLYDLQIVSYQIIGDVIHEAVLRLSELDAEVVLKLVRNCGAQFRRDDPATLKKIILGLNERVAHIPQDRQSSRFKFMLESILDLKNNKQKTAALQNGDLETAKKLLRNMAQQRAISKFEPLRIGLNDIRNADTRGRWWLVGGTWAPEADKQKRLETKAAAQQHNSMAALAKEQRMNTDTRKAIFSALVSSDDYVDAFQRIVSLKLTSKQERDIAAVVLHCCVQEKVYNPFYALVAQRFISFRHNHLITFKYAFWDWLQQVDDASLRKISHLAKFYCFLFLQLSLPLSILEKADLLHLADKEAIFFQMLFARLLTEANEETISAIFESLSGKQQRKTTQAKPRNSDIFEGCEREDIADEDSGAKEKDFRPFKAALQVFFAFYLKDRSSDELPFVSNLSVLSKRIDYVSCYLK
jgi:nucleolar MIF4G domain-containing protein 1